MGRAIILGILITLASPLAARTLAPASPWRLEATEGGCLLQRDFGEGAQRVTFGLRRLPLTDQAELIVVPAARVSGSTLYGRARVGADKTVWRGEYTAGRTSRDRWFGSLPVPAAQIDSLSKFRQLDVAFGSAVHAQLADPGLADALVAEKRCEGEVLRSWGVSAEALERVATPAVPINPVSWVSDMDYPRDAERQSITSRVVMVWQIDPTGRPTGCRVVQSSGIARLDENSCRAIATRAHYRPARDRDGQPVASWDARLVDWTLPQG